MSRAPRTIHQNGYGAEANREMRTNQANVSMRNPPHVPPIMPSSALRPGDMGFLVSHELNCVTSAPSSSVPLRPARVHRVGEADIGVHGKRFGVAFSPHP